MKNANLFRIAIAILLSTAISSFAQVVSPLQTGHYTPGVMNVRDMSNPSPGLFLLWYNMYATSNTYIDIEGNEITNLNQIFPNLNVDVGYDVKVFASIPMIYWASKKISFLGDANYLGGISLNYTSVQANVFTERQGVIIDTTYRRSGEGSLSGFSDMFVAPLGLSWGLEMFDITLMYGITAPTGKFEIDANDNLGLGFWTHQLLGYGYYYPVPDKSTAIMVGLSYELSGRIKDSEVTPGNRFSVEYGISQYLSDRFELAVQGGHNFQISDDTGDGVYWNASRHDRKSMVAFYGNYWPWKERLSVSLKYGLDYGARGRGLTNYWMLNLLFIPNVLTGE